MGHNTVDLRGQIAYSWVSNETGLVPFQSFIFKDLEPCVRYTPREENVRPAEVVWNGERWVENIEPTAN
jgi:hypothetical protein